MGFTLDEGGDKADIGRVVDSIGCGCAQMMVACFAGSFFCLEACVLTMFSFLLPVLEEQFDVSGFGASLLGVSAFFGMFLGCFFWGWFSDKFGRKDSILICCIMCIFFGCCSSVSFHEVPFGICAFFFGFGIGGGVIGFSYYIEFLPTKMRGITLINIEAFWTIGVILECLISWGVLTGVPRYNWNFLVLITILPCLITVALIPFLPRSPRYLVVTNNPEDLEHTIRWMERWNCRKRDPKYDDIRVVFEKYRKNKKIEEEEKEKRRKSIEAESGLIINDDEKEEEEETQQILPKKKKENEEKDYNSTTVTTTKMKEEEEEEDKQIVSSEDEIILEVDVIQQKEEEKKKKKKRMRRRIKEIDDELEGKGKGEDDDDDEDEQDENESEELEEKSFRERLKLLCKCETIFLFVSIIIFYTAGSFGYYGVALATPNFFSNQNEYLGTFVISFAEFPGLFISSIALYTVGRKATQTLTFLLTSLGLVLLVIPNESLWMTILFGFLARGAIMGASSTSWVIAQESIPTSLRSLGCGVAAGIAKGATCLAPVVVEVFPQNNSFIPKVLFGLATAVAGILCIFYPFETKGKNLSDFVVDGVGGKEVDGVSRTNSEENLKKSEYERML